MKEKKLDYSVEIQLYHDEIPGKVNPSTGEFTSLEQLTKKVNTIKNMNVVNFQHSEIFQRTFIHSWNLLRTQTTDKEFRIATLLALMAKPFTNSLEPINDDTTSSKLAELLSTSRNDIKLVTDKLYELGVFGKFSYHATTTNFKNYWIFNPYLTFNGNKIDKSILGLFEDSVYKKVSLSQ